MGAEIGGTGGLRDSEIVERIEIETNDGRYVCRVSDELECGRLFISPIAFSLRNEKRL